MGKKKSEIPAVVSGAGWIGSLAGKLIAEARRQNIPAEQIHAIVTETEVSDEQVARIVEIVFRRWYEKDGIIYFTVTSNGRTGEQWIEYFEKKGVKLSDYAKQLLRSPDFRPTNGEVYHVAVLKGELFSDSERITKSIRAKAESLHFETPNAELACLIRDMFTDEEIEKMGLTWIITMHEPIEDSDGVPVLLGADRDGDDPWLHADYVDPDVKWNRRDGFAVRVPQVSSET